MRSLTGFNLRSPSPAGAGEGKANTDAQKQKRGADEVQITRETDYAIRCVCHLAQRPGEIVAIEEISRATSAPKDFIAKILQKLASASIVKSHRGVNGGFELAKKPALISFLCVVEAVQGPVAMNICAIDKRLCSRSDSCIVHPVWVDVREQVRKILAKNNFAKLKSKRIRGEMP
ncbi:MAG: Rrf2 family transcriptional regulator [Nitrospiraceae bacterium]|nr:Rrf2 family transcriptional regulator [Nitrospiraceae bacterium]